MATVIAGERPIEEIREAFLKIHHVATGKSDQAYMSIPADPERDADLILSAAISELEGLRTSFAATKARVRHLHAAVRVLRKGIIETSTRLIGIDAEALRHIEEALAP